MGVAPAPVELAPGVAESGGGAVAYGPAFGFQEMDDFVEIKTESRSISSSSRSYATRATLPFWHFH